MPSEFTYGSKLIPTSSRDLNTPLEPTGQEDAPYDETSYSKIILQVVKDEPRRPHTNLLQQSKPY